MALINCPECGKEISDKASACPNCGMPMEKINEICLSAGSNNQDVQPEMLNEDNSAGRNQRKVFSPKSILIVLVCIATAAVLLISILFIRSNYLRKKRLDDAINAVVKVVCLDAYGNEVCTGSGFFYRDCSHVVTNYHVIEDACSITVITNDEVRHDIDIIFYASQEMDLAVLYIDTNENLPFDMYPHLESVSRKATRGDRVFAIGSPLGIKNTLSEGIISGTILEDGMNVIQTTAPISSGSSGGALIDSDGYVVGVTYAYYIEGQNMNLALPIELLEKACPGPLWKGSLCLTPAQFYSSNHTYGVDLQLALAINKNVKECELADIRRNYKSYKEQAVAFKAFVSSVYEARDYYLFFLSDTVITDDCESDVTDYDRYGIEQSDLVVARVMKADYNHIDTIKSGELVRFIGVDMNDENNVFMTMILYNEESGNYISLMQNLADIMRERGQ